MSITRTFKNHCGQFHKTNTTLVVLTSLYVIGAAVALSAPYWVSPTCTLAPLAAFAATPLGIGILAFVAIALTALAIRAIIKNNEISELKAPKVIKDGLLVTRDVFKEMQENNKNKDKAGQLINNQYYIDFGLGGKNYRIIIGDNPTKEQGNTLIFSIDSLEVENNDGKYVPVSDKSKELEALGLKEQNDEVNTYLGQLSSVKGAASKGQNK